VGGTMIIGCSRAARRAGSLATIAALAIGSPAMAGNIDFSLAQVSASACPFQVGARMSCGELSVPENWSKGADSRRISVPFIRVAAKHPKPNRVPVAILTGGPGATIFMALGLFANSPLTDGQEAIFIEPRGYGYAKPGLVCESVADLAACHERWQAAGYDLSQYVGEAAVTDFEALRRALKLGPWNIYGISYGGYFALTEVRLFPDGIRGMVLDSPAPPEANYDENRVSALNVFARVFDACKADRKCNAAYPDLRARFIQGIRKLDASAVSFNGKPMSGGAASKLVYHALYMTPSFRFTPKLADALARGDIEGLMKASEEAEGKTNAAFNAPRDFDPKLANALGLNAQMVCADFLPFPGNPELAEAFNSPWPQDIIRTIQPEGWDYDKRCAAWPTKPSDPVAHSVVESNIPALVLSGRFDPIVSLRMSEVTALHLHAATIMQDPNAAHIVIAAHHGCVDRAVDRFLGDPSAEIDTSCLSAIAAPVWATPGTSPAKHRSH
jgi:pimeloyl-ACP methyl ester carboxylesterase